MLNFDLWKQTQFFLGFFKKLLTAYWPSLLVLLLGICLPLLVFEELAVVIWRNDGSFAWDESLLLAIHQTAQPQLDTFAVIFTKLGVSWGVIPVATAIALVLLRSRRWRSLTYFLTALLGNGLINRIAKEFLHRVRPNLWQSISPEFDYAFPSGHAMSSMSFIAALVILTWSSRWRWLILAGGSVFVVAIGWTRLYLGVHFPSDILAGWMVAIAWAVGVSLLIRPNLIKLSPLPEEKLTVNEEEAIASE